MEGNNIRNVVVLGHQGSGKTSLIESFVSTITGQPKGSIEKKNTISDYLPEEQSRGSSVRLSIVPAEYNGTRINFLDVPGNDDFISEAIGATSVVKGAILVLDAANGVEVESLKHWHLLKRKNIPTIIFVNKMDKENVVFENILAEIREKLGKNAIPFSYPMGHQENFDGFVNVVELKARKYNGKTCEDCEIYPDKRAKIFELHNMMIEAVAQTKEELLEKFFSGEALTSEEIKEGLRTGVLGGELIPVVVGCATKNIGVHTMLDMMINYLPNPADLNPVKGVDQRGNEIVRKSLSSEPFSAFVFKSYVDSYSGLTSIFKIYSGSLNVGDELIVANINKTFTVNQLFRICGGKQQAVSRLEAGDIGAINKVDGLETSHTLCTAKNYICYPSIDFPTPVYYKGLVAKSKNDDDKLGSVLAKLLLEDKSLEVKRNYETNQLLIGSLGTGHLNLVMERMRNNYKLEVQLEDAKIVYRETIEGKSFGTGRYVKQSGGSGFYGVVEMEFSPAEDEKNIFTEEVFGGAVPKNYFPAVEKGFLEACEKGLLAGYPVIGVHACLKDGKYHAVDSNELSFKMAGILAFKDAYLKCKPVILEPIIQVVVTVHSDDVGAILSDLNTKRAKIIGMDINSMKDQKITALVPESEILEYVNDLKSLTQGSGYFNRSFYGYEKMPSYLQEKLVKA